MGLDHTFQELCCDEHLNQYFLKRLLIQIMQDDTIVSSSHGEKRCWACLDELIICELIQGQLLLPLLHNHRL